MINEIDGVIKYKTNYFTQEKIGPIANFQTLAHWRYIFFQLNLIGEYSDGVGFGNLSMKTSGDQFLISASQTGKHEYPGLDFYTLVEEYNLDDFSIGMKGLQKASSETLTHAAIYQSNSDIKFIFHIHSRFLWKEMLKKNYPKIDKSIQYGTPEMAQAFSEFSRKSKNQLIAMEGHQDGILAFGESAMETGSLILKLVRDLH